MWGGGLDQVCPLHKTIETSAPLIVRQYKYLVRISNKSTVCLVSKNKTYYLIKFEKQKIAILVIFHKKNYDETQRVGGRCFWMSLSLDNLVQTR